MSPKSTECSDYEAGSEPSPSPPTPPSREPRADRFGERNGGARISSSPARQRHPKVEERNVTPVPGEFFLRAVTAFFRSRNNDTDRVVFSRIFHSLIYLYIYISFFNLININL